MKRSAGSSTRTGPAGDRAAASPRPGTIDAQVGPAGDAFEREADRVADAVVRGGRQGPARPWTSAAGGRPDGAIQRKCADCREEEDEQIRRMAKGPEPAGPSPQTGGASPAAPVPVPAETTAPEAPGLIVDGEGPAARGQMSKAEFLATLRAESCAAVDAALAGTGRDSDGCPWIDHWFGYYEGRSAAQIERALLRYAPEAAGTRTARGYVRLVVSRVRQSAATYARTGQVTGLPADVPLTADAPLDAVGGMFFKARPGGPRNADPASVRDQLGPGQPMPGTVRARMESAFGRSFGGVRLHTDGVGAHLSDGLNARAFTVGRHVAFGRGEFRPGTIAGDALIAHELAHVVQQGASNDPRSEGRTRGGNSTPLERDADRSAVSAVASLWNGARGSARRMRSQATPTLQSGLALSRCGTSDRQKEINRLGDVQYGFLEKRRKEEEDRLRKEMEEDAKKKGLPPPATAPTVDLADVTNKDADKHALPASPTADWDSVADKPAWEADAKKVIESVVASVKGTEIEPSLTGLTIEATPERALKEGYYAKFSPRDHKILVSMSWIALAKKNPKNVWENIVHEGGGHRAYGGTYSSEIMEAALSKLPAAQVEKIKGKEGSQERRKYFEAYGYPETEIYSAVWQRRYQHPESGNAPETGGIDTDENIVKRLNVMKDVLEPTVMVAVLKELKRRIDANAQILPRDRKFFVDTVKNICKVDL